jgi:hypothetical protein
MSFRTRPCSRPRTTPGPRPHHARGLAQGLRPRTPPPLPPRLANPSQVHPDLHPVTGADAGHSAKLLASPCCPTRPKRQKSNPESRSRWTKVGGKVTIVKAADTSGRWTDNRDLAIRQIVNGVVTSKEIVDTLSAAGLSSRDISIFSDDFLAEVSRWKRRIPAFKRLGNC